jgi:hypothetical protein
MIFYLAIDNNNQTKIVGTQADAKALNPQFEQIDIPVDKVGLMGWIQMMLDETLNAVVTTTDDNLAEATALMQEADAILNDEPAPKTAHNKFSPHPLVNEILTLAEIDECIDILDERRLKQIELSISQRRDKLAREAAKAANVEAD